MAGKHPGFKAVQQSIAKKQGISSERAGAILAAGSRNASKAAHKSNPRLSRVKGKMHEGGVIPESGAYEMEEGEHVTPAEADVKPNARMTTELGVPVPASTEDARAPLRETVSATPNSGCPMEAAPTVDGGRDSGVGHWEGDGDKVAFHKA